MLPTRLIALCVVALSAGMGSVAIGEDASSTPRPEPTEQRADHTFRDRVKGRPVVAKSPGGVRPDHPRAPRHLSERPSPAYAKESEEGGSTTAGPIPPQATPISDQPEDAAEFLTQTPMRLYAWQSPDQALDGIVTAVLTGPHESAGVIAQRCRSAWDGLPGDQRCLMVAPMGIFQGPPFERPLTELVRQGGPDLSSVERWWDSVLWSLQKQGLEPARVALDWESGMGYWNLAGKDPEKSRVEEIGLVLADPALRAKLPAEVLAFKAEQFDWRVNRDAVLAWEQYANHVRAEALHETFTVPLHRYFPQATITNYQDGRYGFVVRDVNGWPKTEAMIGSEASPSLYSKDSAVNVSYVRSTIEGTGKATVPWVSFPSYIGREAWEQTLRQMHAMGVREVLYWNPESEGKPADDDAFAAEVVRSLNASVEASILQPAMDVRSAVASD